MNITHIIMYTIHTYTTHSLGTRHWADEGKTRQLDFEVNLLSAGPLFRLDHVGECSSKLLSHQEALDVEGELTLIGLSWGKLEGNLDTFMSRCTHLGGKNDRSIYLNDTWNQTFINARAINI